MIRITALTVAAAICVVRLVRTPRPVGGAREEVSRTPAEPLVQEPVEGEEKRGVPVELKVHFLSLHDKDLFTVEHSEDVARYALLLAEELQLSERAQRELHKAGMFHDIGKILIPDPILKKPGRLTDEEFDVMKRHVTLSDEILSEHYTSDTMKQAVVCHHERFDGRGYPHGLKGRDIPLVGRIMAIADAFSAMTLDRVYRKSRTIDEALVEIRNCAGTQFDPELSEVFCHAIESGRGD